MKQTLQVEIEKSGYDLLAHLAKIVSAVKTSQADGFQVGNDLPVIITSLVTELPAIMAAVPSIGGEFTEDKIAFIKGANLGLYEIISIL